MCWNGAAVHMCTTHFTFMCHPILTLISNDDVILVIPVHAAGAYMIWMTSGKYINKCILCKNGTPSR